MAEASAPKKTRKAQGPRQQKPVFAVVSATDESGNPIALNKSGLSIRLERDAATLLDMLEGGMGNQVIVRVELPATATRAKAEPAA
jgi:hypothetical protein